MPQSIVCLTDQSGIERNAVCLEGITITLQTKLTDALLLCLRYQNGNPCMPKANQIIHHPRTFPAVIHTDARIRVFVDTLQYGSHRAEHERYRELLQLFLRVGEQTTQKNNSPQSLFLYHLLCHIHFVLICLDM